MSETPPGRQSVPVGSLPPPVVRPSIKVPPSKPILRPLPNTAKAPVHSAATTPVMQALERAAMEFDEVAESVNGGIEAIEARLQLLPAKAAASTDSPTDQETSVFFRYSFEKHTNGEWRIFYRPGIENGFEDISWQTEKSMLLSQASADLKIDAVPHLLALVVAITERLKAQAARLREAKAALHQIVPFIASQPTETPVADDDIPF